MVPGKYFFAIPILAFLAIALSGCVITEAPPNQGGQAPPGSGTFSDEIPEYSFEWQDAHTSSPISFAECQKNPQLGVTRVNLKAKNTGAKECRLKSEIRCGTKDGSGITIGTVNPGGIGFIDAACFYACSQSVDVIIKCGEQTLYTRTLTAK